MAGSGSSEVCERESDHQQRGVEADDREDATDAGGSDAQRLDEHRDHQQPQQPLPHDRILRATDLTAGKTGLIRARM